MNSTTGNGSIESSSCFSSTTAYKIGGTVALSLILAVSLMANSFIVLIVYRTPTLRKPMNYFIANMAMSDLLYSIFLIPFYLSAFHTTLWPIGRKFGLALCKLVPFFHNVSIIVSIQNLILIAVNRFGAVVFPLRSPLIRSKLCPFFISAMWIVAGAVSSPNLFTFQLVEYSGEIQCQRRWKKAFGESSSFTDFLLPYCVLLIFIPVMLLVILYSIILAKLKTQAHPDAGQSVNTQQHRKRQNRNVLQMSIAIVLVFVSCWLPFYTNFFVIEYSSVQFSCAFLLYFDVAVLMTVAYCAINPIICFVFSSNYRQGLKRLMNCS